MRAAPLRLVRLTGTLPVAAFSCGDAAIDAYLHQQALSEQEAGLATVYVALRRRAGTRVVGYFTLSPLTVRIDPRVLEALGLTSVPYPAVGGYLLGRLGVSIETQHQGIGAALVMAAYARARRASKRTGGVFLGVDAKDERLVGWYQALGFVSLGKPPRRLVLRF